MTLRSAAFAALAAFFASLPAAGAADSGVAWKHNLKKAAAESQRTGKPILLQFKADWCGYCHKMLRETFPDEKLARQIEACFVPVLLDVDENDKLVETIGVNAFPSTIIISPKLDVIGRVRGFHTARSLEKKLTPFCDRKRLAAANKAGAANKIATVSKKPAAARLPVASIPPAMPEFKEKLNPQEDSATNQKPAFDGLCLVSMLKERKRIAGSSIHNAVFAKTTLHFASKEHLAEFQAKPEKYWPLLDGQCPVSKTRGEKNLQGDPKTVAVFRGQLIFFKDLAHREDFAKNPRGYLEESRTAQK
ncbi:MAG: thioredoxin family protein [Planctomycetes bacterium]|nr:thioredoxin family protein [Planctomycetota bacterium]